MNQTRYTTILLILCAIAFALGLVLPNDAGIKAMLAAILFAIVARITQTNTLGRLIVDIGEEQARHE